MFPKHELHFESDAAGRNFPATAWRKCAGNMGSRLPLQTARDFTAAGDFGGVVAEMVALRRRAGQDRGPQKRPTPNLSPRSTLGSCVSKTAPDTVTQILESAEQGAQITDRLLPLVYEELRRLAARQMAAESPTQTLQPTALVHEAYLRLVGGGGPLDKLQAGPSWESRGHFYAAAARAMRQILINRAHRRHAVKHGGGRAKLTLNEIEPLSDEPPPERMLAFDEALKRLEERDPRSAEMVSLRYFAGLSVDETAQALQVSSRTVKRDCRFAKAWLHREMTRDGSEYE